MITPKVPRGLQAADSIEYEAVTNRDEGRCQRCGTRDGVNRDHRLNRSQGGRTVAHNMQLLCGSGTTGCHGWATTHPAEAVAEGWAVPMGMDPEQYPARRLVDTWGRARLAWVLYFDDQWIEISDAEAAARRAGGEIE